MRSSKNRGHISDAKPNAQKGENLSAMFVCILAPISIILFVCAKVPCQGTTLKCMMKCLCTHLCPRSKFCLCAPMRAPTHITFKSIIGLQYPAVRSNASTRRWRAPIVCTLVRTNHLLKNQTGTAVPKHVSKSSTVVQVFLAGSSTRSIGAQQTHDVHVCVTQKRTPDCSILTPSPRLSSHNSRNPEVEGLGGCHHQS